MALPTPDTILLPRMELGVPSGIFTGRYTQGNFLNGSSPAPLTAWYKPSAALLLSGGEYLQVVGLNDDKELIVATLDSADSSNNVQPIGVLGNSIPANTATLDQASVYIQGNFNREFFVFDDTFDSERKKEVAFIGAPTPTNIITGVGVKRPPAETDT